MAADPKNVIAWVITLVMPVAIALVLTGFIVYLPYEALLEIVKAHFAAILGLPTAAVFSIFLVVALQQTSGPVKFEGLGFKFEGTSGQVVLWAFCFLSIAASIKLLWNV